MNKETKETYNGWTNYATWRVNLEIIDGINFVKEDITSNDEKLTVYEIAEFLKENVVESAITKYGELTEGLALDYARAFVSEVNYVEIAKNLVENNSSLLE